MLENNLFAQSTVTTSERIRIHQPRSDDSVVSGGCSAADGLVDIQAKAFFCALITVYILMSNLRCVNAE